MSEIRRYQEDDFEQIAGWLVSRGLPRPPYGVLPDTGFIAPGLAAGFVYFTNSDVAFADWFITDPKAPAFTRGRALFAISESILGLARQGGHKIIKMDSKFPSVIRLAKAFGFKDAGVYHSCMRGL